VLDLARSADSTGWHGIWFADHYMPNTGSEEVAEGDVHECWAILPAIAAATENIRLGPLVAPTSVHHPALLANRAVTIDHVSNGRFVLGLGAGWQINEHHAYGIELEPAKVRVDRFEEAIQIVRSLLDQEHTDFSGEHYTITNAPCDPKPVQEKLPILVGTGSPRMLRITATHAQEWNTWGAPELAAERRADYVRQCERVGVEPASLHTSVQALFFFQDDPAAVEKILAGEMGDRTIAGSIQHIVEQIGRYVELGFDEVIVPDFTLGRTHDERLATYATFMSEVASQFG
jgi:alkanesulfonate monooxygenase SsuD/methylene tetrahydromethanopterin reductase-like flavin-dependent oxidoreductase (luciferase family)